MPSPRISLLLPLFLTLLSIGCAAAPAPTQAPQGKGESAALPKLGPTSDRATEKHKSATPKGIVKIPNLDSPEFRARHRSIILRETNRHRADLGIAPLTVHPALERAAQSFSEELAQRQWVGHESLDSARREPKQRVMQEGVRGRWVGENAANQHPLVGDSLGYRVVADWMGSEGHRKNLLKERYRYIGIGLAQKDGEGFWYLVQVFAEDVLPLETPK